MAALISPLALQAAGSGLWPTFAAMASGGHVLGSAFRFIAGGTPQGLVVTAGTTIATTLIQRKGPSLIRGLISMMSRRPAPIAAGRVIAGATPDISSLTRFARLQRAPAAVQTSPSTQNLAPTAAAAATPAQTVANSAASAAAQTAVATASSVVADKIAPPPANQPKAGEKPGFVSRAASAATSLANTIGAGADSTRKVADAAKGSLDAAQSGAKMVGTAGVIYSLYRWFSQPDFTLINFSTPMLIGLAAAVVCLGGGGVSTSMAIVVPIALLAVSVFGFIKDCENTRLKKEVVEQAQEEKEQAAAPEQRKEQVVNQQRKLVEPIVITCVEDREM